MLTLKIKQDSDPVNPREDFDHIGRMVCWHRRYTLGDEQPRIDGGEWREDFDREHPDGIVLPLYLYDHSGITISVQPFNDRWDSGQVGWIYMTRETLNKEFPAEYPAYAASEDKARIDAERIERAEACLRAEVAEYDQYLTGNVWGFELYNDDEHVDSCWGFYGDPQDAIKDHLPSEAHALIEDAWEART